MIVIKKGDIVIFENKQLGYYDGKVISGTEETITVAYQMGNREDIIALKLDQLRYLKDNERLKENYKEFKGFIGYYIDLKNEELEVV